MNQKQLAPARLACKAAQATTLTSAEASAGHAAAAGLSAAITTSRIAARAAILIIAGRLVAAGLTKRSATMQYNATASGGLVLQQVPYQVASTIKYTVAFLTRLTTGTASAGNVHQTSQSCA